MLASFHHQRLIFASLMDRAHKMSVDLLSWPSWQKWCIGVFSSLSAIHHKKSAQPDLYKQWAYKRKSYIHSNAGESPAVEVMNFEDPEGFFASKTYL